MHGLDRCGGRKIRWSIEHQKAIRRGAGVGAGSDGSSAGDGNPAAAGRRGNKGCGVAGAAWLMALSYVRSVTVSVKPAKCLDALSLRLRCS